MHNEQVFTPYFMVKLMLDFLRYTNKGILQKYVMDNSCGKGAFLKVIVDRYCKEFCNEHNYNTKGLKEELEEYICGIEIDETCLSICIAELNKVAFKYGITNVNWRNVRRGDSLEIHDFDGRMDYVVGNPPYCNVHHFGDKYDTIKKYKFSQSGMSDLYLVFFEIGLNMLKDDGQLLYITPSSWTNSIAGKPFREYLLKTGVLSDVVMFGHEKIFKDATTFTMLTKLQKNWTIEDGVTSYVNHSSANQLSNFELNIEQNTIRKLPVYTNNGKFYFNEEYFDSIKLLRGIEKHDFTDVIKVKNGFATLNDRLFVIRKIEKNENVHINDKNVILSVKASTDDVYYMVFPYDMDDGNRPLKFDEFSDNIQKYLTERMNELIENGIVKEKKENWWLYGRSQGINDVSSDNRLVINNLLRGVEDIKTVLVGKNVGVYSGYYCDFNNITEQERAYICNCIESEEFVNYVKSIGKYKNGGYYTFSTKELQDFLNYKLSTFRDSIKNILG